MSSKPKTKLRAHELAAPLPASSLGEIKAMAMNASDVLEQVRQRMLDPFPRKKPPTFSMHQVSSMCGMSKTVFKNKALAKNPDRGFDPEEGGHRQFTLKDAINFVKESGRYPVKPEGRQGKVISICSYKGGVGKTTSAVMLAQGLSLRGLKVLFIDLDGQGSSTTLFGTSPELEVRFDQTVAQEIVREKPDFMNLVQPTYWDGLDYIPANSSLLYAEFHIPMQAGQATSTGASYNIYGNVAAGLESVREHYDVIVMDTSPSLNYLTQNAIFGSDMLLAPCPQNGLDFASLAQFWNVFSDLADGALDLNPEGITPAAQSTLDFMKNKRYDLTEVFLTMCKSQNDELGNIIRGWIKQAFAGHFWDVGIPESTIPESASAQMRTVYDLVGAETTTQSYKRFKEPVEAYVDHILSELTQAWRR